VVPAATRVHIKIPRWKFRHAVVPKAPAGDISYPDEGVILAPATAGYTPRTTAATVLSAIKNWNLTQNVLGSAISSVPTIELKLVTENNPTYPGLSPGVQYNAWVLTYTGVTAVSFGLHPASSNVTCTAVAIYDIDKAAWTTLFTKCPG
jgi:hypothetical protein